MADPAVETDQDVWGADTPPPAANQNAPTTYDTGKGVSIGPFEATAPTKTPAVPAGAWTVGQPHVESDQDVWGEAAGDEKPVTLKGVLAQIPGAVSDTLQGLQTMAHGALAYGPEGTLFPEGGKEEFNRLQATDPRVPDFAPPPANLAERATRFTAGLLPGAFVGPGGEAGALANVLTRAGNVVMPAVGGVGASEITRATGGDSNAQALAGVLGSLPGSFAMAPGALRGVWTGAKSAAEPFLATMGKPVEIAPGVFGTPSAADQAGAFLAKQAADLPAVRRALEGVVPDTVPGSTRTLGAATGDVGLLQNERNVVTGKPPVGSGNGADISNTTRYNVQVLGPQQAARTASLKSLADGGDAAAVGDHIRGVIADLDTRLQADVDAARTAGEASTKAANARGEAHVAAATDTGQRDVEAAQARSTADVGAAQDRAKQVAESLGGNGNPEDYGTTIRGHVADALKASDAREAGLWNAIDPDRKLTGNVSATKIAGRSIIDNMSPYDVPMNADESRIFAQVQELPPVAPLKDIVALRRSINDAASTELKTKGVPTASYARLSALRAALNDNLANTISDQVGRPGVAARVEAWENASGPQSAVRSGTGGAGQPTAGTGTPVVSATGGTALSAGSGSGSAAAAAGVSSEISPDLTPIRVGAQVVGYTAPDGTVMNAVQARAYRSAAPAPASTAASPPVTGQPTIDADALARMKAANAATAEQAQIYRQGPVEPTLRTYGFADQYQMAAGKVPAQFFKPGADGYEAMKALERASPEAMPAIHDYAASTLRDMAAKNDGIITPKILQAWESRYSDSLRALPDDMRVKFGLAAQAGQNVADRTAAADAAVKAAQETSKTDIANAKTLANEYTQAAADSANKTVSEAISRRKQTLHDAQAGAIGRVMGATSPDAVTKTVGSILEGPRGSDDMRALVNATRSNPDAAAGLKQAVVDHIVQKYMSNAEAGLTETNKLSANAFQTFLRKSEPALSQVLAPAEIGRLTAISRDMDESARAMSLTRMPGESNTYEKLARGGLSNGKNTRSLLDLLAASGGGIGAATHGAGLAAIPIGAAAGKLTDLIQGLRNRGIQNVADLVREGTFNANVGRALLARVKDPADTPKLGRALLKALIAPSVAATAAARPQSQQPSALQGVS